MKAALLILGLALATTYASIVDTRPERKLADAEFLKRQKLVLDLYTGLGHTENFHNEYSDYDLHADAEHFHKPELVKSFMEHWKHGFLPVDAIFTFSCHHTVMDTMLVFDLFYSAKDFTTFYKFASWARKHMNPMQFGYAYTVALIHREDCQHFELPPFHEVVPHYFVPADTMHQVYDARLMGIKERRFPYNNTGYEYTYHNYMFGGPFHMDATGHMEYKISYFREDIGLNGWYVASNARFPDWMKPENYRGSYWYRRGEHMYYRHQQILARYLLERMANGMPYIERFWWDRPIRVGYNPRVSHFNGQPFYTRPDNLVPKKFVHKGVSRVEMREKRLMDAIDAGAMWNMKNNSLMSMKNEDGIDHLGRMVFGIANTPSQKYFGRYFWEALEVLGQLVHTSNDREFLSGAMGNPGTVMRDPLYYQFLHRVISMFQMHKKYRPQYTEKDLHFEGVKVNGFEVDKLVTYFEDYEFEVTNAIPVQKPEDINEMHYMARQFRLNHKPYHYKVMVHSEKAEDALVRVYIGPKYNAEEIELNLEQSRMAFVEIDRFPVTMAVGENMFERNSMESTLFSPDPESFRSLFRRVNNAMSGKEQFYYTARYHCGLPNRHQLPRGMKDGHPYIVAVIVTPLESVHTDKEKSFYAPCGSSKMYDHKSFGFPFDRPMGDHDFHDVPNFLFKEVMVYHQEETEVNRPTTA